MASFKDFLSTFSSDSGEKGKQFERFVKWFLLNDPTWKSQVEQVWHWDEYPNRWGKDLGIDLVFRHKNGDLWAVQAKCYAESTSITKAHVDSFISESDRKTFAGRLLIGTTNSLADNAKKVCDRQSVTRFLLSDFESSAFEFPAHYEELSRAEPPKPPPPRAHQLEAISAVKEGFKDTDRGQLIMACGTGKTFTTLWIKEALEAESTLILLPSLGLLSQTRQEWTRAANKPFEVLCVCSDDSVGKRGDDEIYESVAQLPFPVTSDPQRIQAFLELQKPKVVFSTYQSSPLVAEAQAANTGIEFDLIVADEAHRCAGVVGDGFSSVLNGQRLKGRKRLFATATPRTYSKQIKSAAQGRGIEVVGMDDEAVFGKPLYTLSFGEAIERKLLTDYRVVIVGVDDAMLASWIENREIVRTQTGIQTDAKSLAAAVGLLKAIKDYDLHRLISFHSRVKGAGSFAEEIHEVQNWLPQEVRLAGKLNSDYVSGAMPTDKRRQKLSQLKSVADGEVALLSNARCLSEGVDVPSLDGVAFIDPKNSQIDIIQAVGRAIRLSTNKTAGTIVLPVFIEKGDTAEEAIERSDFKQVWGVLAALKAHDEGFANEVNQLRMKMGSGGQGFFIDGVNKIIIDLPKIIDTSFANALRAELVTAISESWEEWFGRLSHFVSTYGNASVPAKYEDAAGYKLGYWVRNQRAARLRLDPSKHSRLQSLVGWTWDPQYDDWLNSYASIKEFAVANGTVVAPRHMKTESGVNILSWCSVQRMRTDSLTKEQRSLLAELPGWVENPFEEKWETAVLELNTFVQDFGHSNVPYNFKSLSGFQLGFWVSRVRTRSERLSKEKRSQLEKFPGWVWSARVQKFNEGFNALKKYVDEKGTLQSLRVDFVTTDGFPLGKWVGVLRGRKIQIPKESQKKLESLLGWDWSVRESNWEVGFGHLVEFCDINGHCIVPISYTTESGFALGVWLSSQMRLGESSMRPERVEKLAALRGWAWSRHDALWNQGYEQLSDFANGYGHTNVPQSYVSKSGFKLGIWVANHRKQYLKRADYSEDRRLRLEKLPGWIKR